MNSRNHCERNARAPVNLRLVLRPLLTLFLLILLAGCRQPGPNAPTEINTPAWVTRQHSVDAGYDTWRTDPVQVVRSEIARYGANQRWNLVMAAPVMNGDIGRWEVEVRATSPDNPDQFVVFYLSQPARQGEGGVWVIHQVSPDLR